MIADLKLYPVMKDSGVSWLGGMPEYWDASRVKNLAISGYKTFVDGDWIESPFITSEGIRLIQTGNIGVGSYLEKGFRYISEGTFKAFRCTEFQPNDVLICRLGEPVGRACLAPKLGFRMITSVDVCILKPRHDVLPSFVVYAMSSPQYLSWVNSLVRGSTRDRVSRSMLGSFVIPLPPLPEQSAVVRYLDYIDRRIRKYIRVKQKLIKLLEEQKQAIVHRVVTHGLDPNVRLKPSGVEWLGDIPDHWEVQRTKTMFRLRTEKSGIAHDHELLSIYTHIGVRPRRELEEKGNKASTTDDYWIVKKGDIICNKLLTWMGAIGVSNYDGVTSPAYDILMPIRELVPEFYHNVFRTKLYHQQFKQHSRGIMDMRLRLYFDQFGQIPILVPPVAEQAAIVAYYNDVTANFEKTIETARREISLLREYRTRLIADVVTGKLDVRETAARLPDKADEPELVDEGDAMSAGDEEPVDDLDTAPEEVEV
jgi:type I restriction enzyme, S subunit